MTEEDVEKIIEKLQQKEGSDKEITELEQSQKEVLKCLGLLG